MDSHITIPKSVYKEFVNEKNFYYKYDVKNVKVSKGNPKKTFTEEGYFSDTIEKKLNKFVETPLRELLNFCRELITFDGESIIISNHIKNIAWAYLQSLWARNPKMCEMLSNNSVYYQFVSLQNQHDIAVDLMMDESKKEVLMRIWDLSILINKTDTRFVLPTRGVYEHTINGVVCLAVPINPYVCLHFKEKGKHIHKGDEKNSYLIISKDMDEFVQKLNSFAFINQKNDGVGYVVSSDKNILEQLKDTIGIK